LDHLVILKIVRRPPDDQGISLLGRVHTSLITPKKLPGLSVTSDANRPLSFLALAVPQRTSIPTSVVSLCQISFEFIQRLPADLGLFRISLCDDVIDPINPPRLYGFVPRDEGGFLAYDESMRLPAWWTIRFPDISE
jgi:hypothetical protein